MRPTAAKGVDLLFQPADAVIPLRNSLIDGIFANAKDELVIDLTKLESPEPVTHLMCADSPTLCSWEPVILSARDNTDPLESSAKEERP
ncbi:MAG: hypothetical protein U0236_13345 [Nitrospira sp.]